jgi:flagella basal body P-ring formation protein FlgA
MKKIFLTTLFTLSANACLIQGADSLIVFGKEKRVSFDAQNCTNQQIQALTDVVKESTGTLSNRYLKNIPELANITLKPANIRIRSLEEIIQNRLTLSDEKKIELIQQQFSPEFYKLESDEFIEAYCSDCNGEGLKNLKLVKTDGTKRETVWVKAKILTAVKTFVSKQNVQLNFQAVNTNVFDYKTIYVSNPSEVFTNKNLFQFYRLNKSITKGHIVKTSDLTPVQLVRYGNPVKVTVKNKSLRMNLMANPLASGKLGDVIRLKNRKSKKIFFGKVIGINKVKVEL